MTIKTLQFKVFWALLLSSKHSGVSEDSKSLTFPSVGLHPHTWPKWGCDKHTKKIRNIVHNITNDQIFPDKRISRTPAPSTIAQNSKPRHGKDTKLLKPEKRRSNWWSLQLIMSLLEGRLKSSPNNFANNGSRTSGSSSMPPNITTPKIQLYHGLISTTKHHKNTRTDIFLWICRPPSLRYALLLSLLSRCCGLSLCAWEKEERKAGVLLGQWHSWPLASRRVGCK